MQAFLEKRNDQIFVTKGMGYNFPLHLHAHAEVIAVHQGSLEISVGDESRKLTAGELAVVFPNQFHSYANPSDDNRMTAIVFNLSLSKEYIKTLLQYHPVHAFLEKEQVHENIGYALEQINLEYRRSQRNGIFSPFIQLILARILEVSALAENRDNKSQQIIRRISDYVYSHYKEAISLASAARALGMDKYCLSRLFSDSIGRSFTSYVNSIRLSFACSLLTDSDYSVTEVSEESGFGSLRSFYRTFKSEYGMTPMAYRALGRR